MSVYFSRVTALSDRFGNITQLELGGRVIWVLNTGSDKVVLEVEKITSDTYAGETTYTAEEFILLDIYPKTNGTVSVTYGGLTKTITDTSGAEEPNAQQVYFGTFNGVSDSVATPASGELTIEGDYYAFGCGTYSYAKISNRNYYGITSVKSFGYTTHIPNEAFGANILDNKAMLHCPLKSIRIPKTITTIGECPFRGIDTLDLSCDIENQHYKVDGKCLIEKVGNVLISGFSDSVIPSYVTAIWDAAFYMNQGLTSVVIPEGVTTIGIGVFALCKNLSTITMLGTTPPNVGTNFITGPEDYTIIVPKGCGEAYKSAEGWSTYADYIVEAS